MSRVLGMTGLLVLCVGFSILAQGIPLPQQLKALPDLVILEATYQETGPGDLVFLRTCKFGIGIKNNGPGQAGLWTKAAVFIVRGAEPAWLFGTVDVSPIAAGDALMVFVTRQLSAPVGPCCVFIVVDAPVAGKPLGQMNEGTKGEMNNGFVFFLSPSTGVQTFENPAFHPSRTLQRRPGWRCRPFAHRSGRPSNSHRTRSRDRESSVSLDWECRMILGLCRLDWRGRSGHSLPCEAPKQSEPHPGCWLMAP